MATLIAIAVLGRNREIGRRNKVPEELRVRGDLSRFKRVTWGHPIIMGRKTMNSLGNEPLPGRLNIVLSRSLQDKEGEFIFCRSPEEAILAAAGSETIFIIGGEEIYRIFFDRLNELWLTEAEIEVSEASSFFPEYPPSSWRAYQTISGDGWKFVKYRRI